ncbi:MAG: DNA repair protein RecO [Acidiferrobacterales bacterium]
MRVSQQPAYVLHHYSYGETSLLLEVFTRDHGRLGLLAKGARRMRLRQRPLLEPFQLLLIGWVGRGELPVLSAVEADGDAALLSGTTLYCGFYINELLLRLLHRHDPHERLFGAYRSSLLALRREESVEATLRVFEKRLLQEVGYGLVLENDMTDNAPIDPEAVYEYVINRGPVRLADRSRSSKAQAVTIRGMSLLALAREVLTDPVTLQETKALTRAALGHHLAGKPLNTRKLFRDLKHAPVSGSD